MKATLKSGLRHRVTYTVAERTTVPHTYPDVPVIAAMPEVFAPGFMIILMERACTALLAKPLGAGDGSVGVHIDVSHIAATPVGMTVTAEAECVQVVDRRVSFKLRAHDGLDLIGEGRHERFVVDWDKFSERVAGAKLERVA